LPSRGWLSREETMRREPQLSTRGLQGAATYYDAQASLPERLCLENVLDACRAATPAQVFNYAEVTSAMRDETGKIVGVRVRDVLVESPEIDVRAKLVVNASGPWFDRVDGALAGPRDSFANVSAAAASASSGVADTGRGPSTSPVASPQPVPSRRR